MSDALAGVIGLAAGWAWACLAAASACVPCVFRAFGFCAFACYGGVAAIFTW